MAADKRTRKTRLAAALKENLKRRKTQARAKAGTDGASKARTLGIGLQAGLEDRPQAGPKSAPKRG